MGSGFLNVRFSAALRISLFPGWISALLSCVWHLDVILRTSEGKICNGQSINCLLEKFSPTRMIKSGSEKAWEDISELFINYRCYLFPGIGMENSVPELVWRHRKWLCSTASNFGRPLASLWQITNQSAIFHTCLVSVLLCSGVITAYSISQHPVNDLPALLNAQLPPACRGLSPGWAPARGWAFPALSRWEADCSSQDPNQTLRIPPPSWISPLHNNRV